MKACDVIRRVDELRPNGFEEERKLEWVGELEGRILTEVLELPPEKAAEKEIKYPEDMERELLVKWPYDAMYVQWLTAKMDFANGEYDKYANSMQTFNDTYGNMVRRYLIVRQREGDGRT